MTKKRRIIPYRPIFPSPAALITSVDRNGVPNIITLGEVYITGEYRSVGQRLERLRFS